ncbi:phosphotransferase family protein [Pseudomonas sp. S1(2024)]|uniref:phosphotransferase family protein n=1 Tax=Pseudomonas sp. S1(2024) TaxID=3390191 RepID=UPI003979B350
MIITTESLASNASFVKYVRHHCVAASKDTKSVEIVEKTIKKWAFLSSQEARFHRLEGMLKGTTLFHHPECIGVVETPWESRIFTTFVRGKPPRMHAIASQLARAIAEQEVLSHDYLSHNPWRQAPLIWSMDFFRPWFLLRPRFNFSRCLSELEQLGLEDKRFAGLGKAFKSFVSVISRLAHQAQRSPHCICHMDYLRKNLFVANGQLHLIDWSEVKVGRIGFDGGSYLGSLFRRKEMALFLSAQKDFSEAYRSALPEKFNPDEAARNQHYVFLLTALYHCLRPETIQEYRERDRMPLLLEKYKYLLSLL